MKSSFLGIWLCLIWLPASIAGDIETAIDPVGLTIAVEGQVILTRPTEHRGVAPLTWLFPGDRLEAKAESSLTLVLWDGSRFQITNGTLIVIEAEGPRVERGSLVRLPQWPTLPDLGRLAKDQPRNEGAGVRLRHANIRFASVPSDLTLPLSDTWVYLEGEGIRAGVRLVVEGLDGRIIHQQEGRQNQIEIPAGTLEAESRYFLRVTTLNPYYAGEPGHEIAIKTLPVEDEKAYARLKQKILEKGDDEHRVLHFIADRLGLHWELAEVSDELAREGALASQKKKR